MRGRHSGREVSAGWVVLAALGAVLGCATPIDEARWFVVETDSIELLTTLSRTEAIRLARDLERFDALVGEITDLDAGADVSRHRTQVVALARPGQLAELGDFEEEGLLSLGIRTNLMVVGAPGARRSYVSQHLLHQYAHHLLRSRSSRSFPAWYEEGLAVFLSGAISKGDDVVVGAFPWVHRDRFDFGKWQPFEQFISDRDDDPCDPVGGDAFRAQSWALFRYLALDRPVASGAERRGVGPFLDLLDLGIEPRVAFESAFDEPIAEVSRGIRRAWNAGEADLFRVSVEALDRESKTPVVRTAARVDVELGVGEVLLRTGNAAAAERRFRLASERAPYEARAQAGLGAALVLQGRMEESEAAFRRAVELGPEDASNHLDLGAYYEKRAEAASTPLDAREAFRSARRHFEVALDLDPTAPEALARLGATYLRPGEDRTTALRLLAEAAQIHPASVEIARLLAQAQREAGDPLVAQQLLLRAQPICGEEMGAPSPVPFVDGPPRGDSSIAPIVNHFERRSHLHSGA